MGIVLKTPDPSHVGRRTMEIVTVDGGGTDRKVELRETVNGWVAVRRRKKTEASGEWTDETPQLTRSMKRAIEERGFRVR